MFGRSGSALVVFMALVGGLVTGCAQHPAPAKSRAERVAQAFDRDATAIAEKEGVTNVSTRSLFVGEDQLVDGTRISLWVNDPGANPGVRSQCFYLDEDDPAGGSSGYGGCGRPDANVVLNRNGDVVVGSVGTWPARTVRVTAAGATVELTVVGRFFLVPVRVVGDSSTAFTVTLLDAAGHTIGIVKDFVAPGATEPTP